MTKVRVDAMLWNERAVDLFCTHLPSHPQGVVVESEDRARNLPLCFRDKVLSCRVVYPSLSVTTETKQDMCLVLKTNEQTKSHLKLLTFGIFLKGTTNKSTSVTCFCSCCFLRDISVMQVRSTSLCFLSSAGSNGQGTAPQ